MSGTQVSSFQSMNDLLAPRELRIRQDQQADYHQNALMQQQVHQQALDVTGREHLARAAQWLVNLGDEGKAAALYPATVAALPESLRKYAPAQFPGIAALGQFAAAGVPAEKQAELQGVKAGSPTFVEGLGGGAGGAPGTTAVAPAGGGGEPDYSVPRGIRNNNPLNLSFANQPGAVMETHPNPRFARFGTPEEGIAAAVNQLKLYQSRGNNTLRGMISTWAPPSENDTEAYIKHAAQVTGLNPDAAVNLDDPAVASKLVQAMARQETGRPLDAAVADRGIAARPGSTQTVAAAPGAPAGGGAPIAPYQVASVGQTPPPPMPAAPVALPRAEAAKQAQATGKPVPIAGVDGLWALPNGGITSQPPAPTAPGAAQPPAPPTAPAPAAQMPAALRTNAAGLTPADVKEFTYRRENEVRNTTQLAQLNNDVEQRKAANIRAREHWETQQAAAVTAARLERGERRADESHQLAVKRAADEAAAAAELQKSKSDEADAERVLRAYGPKVRAGKELTDDEADQYDIARRRYARGPVQQVPDGKGGMVTAFVGQEVPDRFPLLPGQKEYAGIKPIPGTEKQPDFAPANAMTAMLDIGEGNRKIVKALENLESYPGGVGPLRGSLPNVISNWTDAEGVKVRAAITDVQGHLYHSLAGTAQSAGEAGRLRGFVPGPADDAEAAKTKLRSMLDSNRQTLLDHYRAFGPDAGGRRQSGIEEEILATIPEAAVERLKKEPDTAKEFDRKFGRGSGKLALKNG